MTTNKIRAPSSPGVFPSPFSDESIEEVDGIEDVELEGDSGIATAANAVK